MSGDRIEYEGSVPDVEGQFVRHLPAKVECRSCERVLLKTKKDHKKKRMSMDVLTSISPEIHEEGAVLCFVCDGCGAKTIVRLRSQKGA